MSLSDHISALIKELKRQKLPEWQDDTFSNLTDPCEKDDGETVVKNLNDRLQSLKETRGSIPLKLSEMADKLQKTIKKENKRQTHTPRPTEKAAEKSKTIEKSKTDEKSKGGYRGIPKDQGDETLIRTEERSSEQPTNEQMEAQKDLQLLKRKKETLSECNKAIDEWLDHIQRSFTNTQIPDFKLNPIFLHSASKMEKVAASVKSLKLSESRLIDQGKEYSEALQRIKLKCNDEQQEQDKTRSAKNGKKTDRNKSESTLTAELVEETIDRLKLTESKLIDQEKEYSEALRRIKLKCNDGQQEQDKTRSTKNGKKADRNKSESTLTAELVEETIDRLKLTESKLIDQEKEYSEALQRIKLKCNDGQQEQDKTRSTKNGKKAGHNKSGSTLTAELVEETIDRLKLTESKLIDQEKEYSEALQRIKLKCNDGQQEQDKTRSTKNGNKADRNKSESTLTAELVEETIDRFRLTESNKEIDYSEALQRIKDKCKDGQEEQDKSSLTINKPKEDRGKSELIATAELVEGTIERYKLRLSDLQGQLKENMKSISMLNADSGETSTSNRNKADQLKSGDDYKTSFANAVGMIEQTLKNLQSQYTKLRKEVDICCCELEKVDQELHETSFQPESGHTLPPRTNDEATLTVHVTHVKETMTGYRARLQELNNEHDGCETSFELIRDMCKQINGRIATDRHGKSANKQNKAQALPRLKESAVNRVTDLTNNFIPDLRDENLKLKKTIEKNEASISELKNRLSKYMGADLRAGNPNIADLSDSNRPTKIGESFTELYDNQWTNAYEELQTIMKFSDTQIIQTLLEILEFAVDYCANAAAEQLPELEYNICTPAAALLKKKDKNKDKKVAVDVITREALAEFRKKSWVASSENLIKNYKEMMEQEKKWKDAYSGNQCSRYITVCIQLCWQMAVQSPPVHIHFEDKNKKKIKFDNEKYKAYTKSGAEVDYVVWPPLYLHEGGSLLSKGIAQAK